MLKIRTGLEFARDGAGHNLLYYYQIGVVRASDVLIASSECRTGSEKQLSEVKKTILAYRC